MRSRVPRSRVTHDRWLVSYADFITLLFAFFVVLFASAKADQKKQMEVAQAIDAAFKSLGIFPDATRKPAKNLSVSSGAERSSKKLVLVGNAWAGVKSV
jgi:chemotaxis protein MotB